MTESNQNWKQLLVVQAGGVICLPVFVIGYALAKSYGFLSAMLAIVIGNGMLLAMGIVVARSSAIHRKSTAECAVELFGERGKGFFTGAMVLSMIGWFAIQLNIMSASLNIPGNVILGIGITLFAIRGMGSLERLASLSMPLLLLTIGYAVYRASGGPTVELTGESFTFSGISLVLASAIAAVVDLPTFFRLANTKRDGIIAVSLLFGLVLPLVEGVGVYLFMQSQGDNIVAMLVQPDSTTLWMLWVGAFLLLAGWTTNNANLYSASVSLKTLLPNVSDAKRTLLVGFMGTVLSCFQLLDHLTVVLDVIGIILGSMGAVMIVHFTWKQKRGNLLAWFVGVVCGFLGLAGYTLTEIPVLDAFLCALITMGIIQIEVNKNEKIINERS